MKQKILFPFFFLTIFLSFNFQTQAQRQVFKSGEVVDAEIQKAKILEWNEDKNIFVVEFNLVNNLDLTQNEVYYALELFDNSKEQGKFLVDRMVGEDLINLAPNGLVTKRIQYNFPASLEKEYELQLVMTTKKGFEFDRKILGLISQKKAQGIFIDITQCQSKVKNNQNHIFKEIDLVGEEKFEIQCKNVKNLSSENLTFIPKIKIRKASKLGEIISEKTLQSQILQFDEQENFSFEVLVENEESFKNYGELFLTDQNGQVISNKIYFSFLNSKNAKNGEKDFQEQFNKNFFDFFTKLSLIEKVGFLVSVLSLILVIILIFKGFFKSKI